MSGLKKMPSAAVIGLGKIGLTLAAVYANKGFRVYGADVNPHVVASVNQGISHVKNEPGLDELVSSAYKAGTLTATGSTADAVRKAEIVVVIVPVLVDEDGHVDYRYIDPAVEAISDGIQKGTLVIFETTLPAGDTRSRFGRKIEERTGMKMGTDFHLAYSPERVYSNRILEDLKKYPKVLGALDDASMQKAAAFYKQVLDCELIKVSSLETAEFSKVAECVYRDVNIALANEMAQYAELKGVNMPEVIKAANSQPYSNIHYPGIGVGGHCIPIYPYFFIDRGLQPGMITSARRLNDSMSALAIDKMKANLTDLQHKHVLILGLSYRENVKEITKSSALLVLKHLKDAGARVSIHDPHFSKEEIEAAGAEFYSLSETEKSSVDVIVLQAYHDEYKQLPFHEFPSLQLVLDGRNALNKEEITKLGIAYEGFGK